MNAEHVGRTAYINARLLDPATNLDQKGALLIEGEFIADIGPNLFPDGIPDDIEIIDCKGACLAPGLIDMRVQLREPGEEHQETLLSAGLAAVAGGVTSMVCLPNTHPVIDDVAALEFVARRARKNGLTKVYPYAAATKGLEGKELSEMGMLAEAGALGVTDGVKALGNAQSMRRALSYAATFDLLFVQHPQDPSFKGVMNEGELASRLGLAGIPVEAEAILLERDMRLVALTGARYHAGHISTAVGVEIIKKAQQQGLPVTCDAAPPYFVLTEQAVGDYRTFAKLSPPLRSESDRLAIVEGLKDGVIGMIASDHAPQDEDSKRLPFAQAAWGGIGLETLLPVSLALYHKNGMSLLSVIEKLTFAPARLLGLAAGRLAKGAPADLVIFDPDPVWTIKPAKFRSKSKNSPFDDWQAQGRVLKTIVDGRMVFNHES